MYLLGSSLAAVVLDSLSERPAEMFSIVHTCGPPKFQRVTIVFGQRARRGLPGAERAAIEMDELRARIIAHPAVLQLQRGTAKLARFDTGNIEVEGLPLDM